MYDDDDDDDFDVYIYIYKNIAMLISVYTCKYI